MIARIKAGYALALLVSLSAFSTGCSTLVKGDSQAMKFNTDPVNATLTVDGKTYTTPVIVKIKRKEPHTVTVSAPGYQTIIFDVTSQWDITSLGDAVLPGGSVMVGVNSVSGADRSFWDLKTIKLNKATSDNPAPITKYAYRGQVMTKEEYDQALKAEREYKTRPPE